MLLLVLVVVVLLLNPAAGGGSSLPPPWSMLWTLELNEGEAAAEGKIQKGERGRDDGRVSKQSSVGWWYSSIIIVIINIIDNVMLELEKTGDLS